MRLQEKKKEVRPAILTFPFLNRYHLFCGFTSKDSGYSQGPYNSLNLAYHVGESQEMVKKNRDLVIKEVLHLDPGYIYSARQVHGDDILYVGKKMKHKDGDIQEDADCLMTDQRSVPVMVMGADCSLFLMVDIKKRVVSAVHAGWKGTLSGIAIKALKIFIKRFGSKNNDINIFIGPGIRQCCYEIDKEMAGYFLDEFGSGRYLKSRKNSYYLDLVGLNLSQLKGEGVPEKNFFDTGRCTCCNDDYYSYRRDGVTGRQAAIALIY